ncbi:hypothetical protein [Pendulispora albinea]|uniref:Uncharacterized protein n=1 Tax=Pendulispora albinea TaxID=2741071 RepID=A0ABZ2MCY5_9BACT
MREHHNVPERQKGHNPSFGHGLRVAIALEKHSRDPFLPQTLAAFHPARNTGGTNVVGWAGKAPGRGNARVGRALKTFVKCTQRRQNEAFASFGSAFSS